MKKFHQPKSSISIGVVAFNQIIVSIKVTFGEKSFKYFIGYKENKKFIPLWTIIPKMNAYREYFDETKYMSFLTKNEEFPGKFDKIWDKLRKSIKKWLIVNLFAMKNI